MAGFPASGERAKFAAGSRRESRGPVSRATLPFCLVTDPGFYTRSPEARLHAVLERSPQHLGLSHQAVFTSVGAMYSFTTSAENQCAPWRSLLRVRKRNS